MARIRSATLLGLFLTLTVTACNRIPETPVTTLDPLFGARTPGLEAANRVAVSEDGVFIGGTWNDRPALIKFSRAGRLPWITRLPAESSTDIGSVATGPDGVSYVIYAETVSLGTYPERNLVLRRYERDGTPSWSDTLVKDTGRRFTAKVATDKNGTLYLFTSRGRELRRYRPDGSLVWRKPVDEVILNLDVSANGFIHTISDLPEVYSGDARRLTRYKPDGTRLWSVPIPYTDDVPEVAVGRENEIYVATNKEAFQFEWYTTLTKYNSRGAREWTRDVQSAGGLRLDGLDADAQGNAFLALTNPDLDSENAYHRKEFYTYSPSGKRLVYKRFDFGTKAALVGPAALSPTEVYLATSGVGAEGKDGLLVRLEGLTGNIVWQR
jgi:outer membrane protein assembly factor BamB